MQKIALIIGFCLLSLLVGCSDSQRINQLYNIINPQYIDFSTINNVQISESTAIKIDHNYLQNASCTDDKCLYLLAFQNSQVIGRYSYSNYLPQINKCYPFNPSDSKDNPCIIKDQIGYEIQLKTTSLNQNPIYVGCYLGNKCMMSIYITPQGQHILVISSDINNYPKYDLTELEMYSEKKENTRLKKDKLLDYIINAFLAILLVISIPVLIHELRNDKKKSQ